MKKNIIIKSFIVLAVILLVHSVFWFFKAGQLEKRINNFVAENSNDVSIAKVEVTGYPFLQKITIEDLKFTIPNQAFTRKQVVVKKFEADSGIFSSDFVGKIDRAIIQDAQNNINLIEFTQEPKIFFSIKDGYLANFSYNDNGYKVSNMEKVTIYSAAASSFTFSSTKNAEEKITAKIKIEIKDIEGFGVSEIYKNSLEKLVMEGLKTGEIVIGSNGFGNDNLANDAENKSNGDNLAVAVQANVVNNAKNATSDNAALNTDSKTAMANAKKPEEVQKVEADSNAGALAIDNNLLSAKNNLVIDMEYTLTPIGSLANANSSDPLQMQENPIQYSKTTKINHLEFSNSFYKITLNGQVSSFQDDNMPSGAITVSIENIDNFIKYINDSINQIVLQKSIIPEVPSPELVAKTVSADMAYHNFLQKIAIALKPVFAELALKNQLSKDQVAVFDLRREKNLEFIINETPIREIMGKF